MKLEQEPRHSLSRRENLFERAAVPVIAGPQPESLSGRNSAAAAGVG